MRIGLVNDEECVRIEPTSRDCYFMVRFYNPKDKFKIPTSYQREGWSIMGFEGYEVYLPTEEIIEKFIRKFFPDIVFVDALNGKEVKAA